MNAYSTHTMKLEALASTGLARVLREQGEDEDGVLCAIESETPVPEMLGLAVRELREANACGDACKALARQYGDQAERWYAREGGIRSGIQSVFEILGLTKMRLPEATLSLGHGQPNVVITDDQLVPMEYRRAAPQVEAAYYGLLRAEAMAVSYGHADSACEFKRASHALLSMFVVDRKKLAAALKEGVEVPGAMLGNPAPWLTVRTRA